METTKIFSKDLSHPRFVEQNLGTSVWRGFGGGVQRRDEAFGRIPHIFYVKVNADPVEEVLAVRTRKSGHDFDELFIWRCGGGVGLSSKRGVFSDSVHLDVQSQWE